LLRVADDILLLCRTNKEAKRAHASLTALLTPAGMPLKLGYDAAVRRLTPEEPAAWLGFSITRAKKKLVVGIDERAWDRLGERLGRALQEQYPLRRAGAILRGWLSQVGPCYAHVDLDAACDRLDAVVQEQGFGKPPNRAAVKARWQLAHARWQKLRSQASETTSA
jgi:hypothetical protein